MGSTGSNLPKVSPKTGTMLMVKKIVPTNNVYLQIIS
jgi:hypothetical protein